MLLLEDQNPLEFFLYYAIMLLHVTTYGGYAMRSQPVKKRVEAHRNKLRAAGLRPVQIWVPDTRQPNFAEECRRQSRLVAQADMADTEMQRFMDKALADVDGWAE
ncbi:MAG: antitoxin MazE family protein [Geobacteraceae bacterium]|nr:antitoxin MazE family protein [Geobacteraceae bacterium]